MPYVPSKKTNPPAEDRELLDHPIEELADFAAQKITDNLSVIRVYRSIFVRLARALSHIRSASKCAEGPEADLARAIISVGAKHGYDGAYLGEANYAITRFIQRVPQLLVKQGHWTQELRYWLYAATVEALMAAANYTLELCIGIGGVFVDIKDEYKRRVNTAYEAEQIMKSGDCYDTPYYTRLVKAVDQAGNHIGYQEVMVKRSDATLRSDCLPGRVVLFE